MDANWPSYRQKAASRIALHIGRLFRGYLARNRVRWLLIICKQQAFNYVIKSTNHSQHII